MGVSVPICDVHVEGHLIMEHKEVFLIPHLGVHGLRESQSF